MIYGGYLCGLNARPNWNVNKCLKRKILKIRVLSSVLTQVLAGNVRFSHDVSLLRLATLRLCIGDLKGASRWTNPTIK